MKTPKRIMNFGVILIGMALGAVMWFILIERASFWEWMLVCWHNVGVTILALLPLSVWAIKSVILQNEDTYEVDLAYVGSQAKEMGFLGTVVGVMIMFTSLSVSLNQGDSSAIKQAIGGFSQAAISTAVGLVISALCKHFRFLKTRQELKGD